MRVLLDTNIILDIALGRPAFVEKAKEPMFYLNREQIPFFVSATTVTNIYYILRKSENHTSAMDFLQNFLQYADIAFVNKDIILSALNSGLVDFEDAVQIQCAVFNQISIIITRNKSDFKTEDVSVYTPDEFLVYQQSK